MVIPFPSNAPLWAALSIPSAIPLTIVIFCPTSSFANLLAVFQPSSEQDLDPIIDMAFVFNIFLFPSTYNMLGGLGIVFNRSG